MTEYTNAEMNNLLRKYQNMTDKDLKSSFEWSQIYQILTSLRAGLPLEYIEFMTTLDKDCVSVYTDWQMREMRFYFEKGYTIEQVKKKLNLK